MARSRTSFAKLMTATVIAAIVAVIVSLLYLASEPGRMRVHAIIATIFGVGLSVLVAGTLTSLMYLSSSSGRDDAVGRGPRRKD